MNGRVALAFGLVLGCATLGLSGCRSGASEDPILRLSAAEALEQGKALMAEEKFARARRYLSHSFEVEPNSLAGREALLLLAESYYLDGGVVNYIQSEAKYRDFLNRFPTSDRSAYAQFQIANSLAGRMEKPDRDQSATRKALEAYEELIRLYPTSEYVELARQKIAEVRVNLAEHEFVIGRFYLRMRAPASAVNRFETLLADFPEYPARDKVLFHLGLALSRSRLAEHAGRGEETFARLRREFPESPYLAKVPEEASRR